MTQSLCLFDTLDGAALDSVQAVVCVPTFRRPAMLARTLDSLAGQKTSVRFAVVVVDNDANGGEGLAAAGPFFTDGRLQGFAIVEELQGNCHAINRAFGAAREHFGSARYFLMIDDDEIAEADWLDTMVAAARAHSADIVGGPVVPVFSEADPACGTHPVFRPAYTTSGPVAMIYGSGNCLITRAAFDRLGSLFDPRFNFLGGGDTEFFTRAKAAGLRFYWAQTAIVRESVGPERVKPTWILKRGLRTGAINYRIECLRADTLAGRAKVLAKNAAVAGVAVYRAARLLVRGAPALETLHPLVVALGRWLALLGIYPEQYRARPNGTQS